MSRGAVVADLVRAQCKHLKMPGLSRGFEPLARQAREERWTVEDYLHECLSVEETSRHESAVRERVRQARFPELKTLDAFDFAAADGVDPTIVADLARGAWITEHRNVILAGPIGTGKTHLAIALGVEAARQRRHVAFWRAADLVRALLEARDARELGRYQRRLERVDVLILDEVGFVPFDRAGGELLFNTISVRHQRRPVVSPQTSPSANGPRSSAATRSSRPHSSTAWPSPPPSSPRAARASAPGSASPNRPHPRSPNLGYTTRARVDHFRSGEVDHFQSGRSSLDALRQRHSRRGAAAIFSIIASCRLHRLDSFAYLDEVLRVLPHWPRHRYLELAPKHWPATCARLRPEELAAPLSSFEIPAELAPPRARPAA